MSTAKHTDSLYPLVPVAMAIVCHHARYLTHSSRAWEIGGGGVKDKFLSSLSGMD